MSGFALYILTALSLILVIEGLLYALFPAAIRSMMTIALAMDEGKLRAAGASMVLAGFGLVLLLQSFANG